MRKGKATGIDRRKVDRGVCQVEKQRRRTSVVKFGRCASKVEQNVRRLLVIFFAVFWVLSEWRGTSLSKPAVGTAVTAPLQGVSNKKMTDFTSNKYTFYNSRHVSPSFAWGRTCTISHTFNQEYDNWEAPARLSIYSGFYAIL